MTTPEFDIDCTSGSYFCLYGKEHETVEDIIEFINGQEPGTLLKFYREQDVGDQTIEKPVYIQKSNIVAIKKNHREYVDDLVEDEE